MDNHINPTLLLGIIGGILLFAATTMINGTIWATSIEMTTPVRGVNSVGNTMMPARNDERLGERDASFRAGDTTHWAMDRRSNMPRSVPVDCVQPTLSPSDELLDAVCEHVL